jgi:HK97 family phage major capsid protein
VRRPSAGQVETRSAPEAAPTIEGRRLRGLIPYGTESRDLGGWCEVMAAGCLREANLDELICTVDHAGVPLARFPTTLDVEDRDDGLHWSLELPESRADIREAVERGDLRSTSWRMVVARERWEGNVRHVEQVRDLRDVAVVVNPAYAQARAELRRAPEPEQPSEGEEQEEAAMAGKQTSGGLRVEDRSAHEGAGTPEARILEAIRSVPPGETRDLTHANTEPVEPDDLRRVLIDKLREASVVAESGVPIVPTDSKKAVWPTLTGDIDVAFYDELEPIAESDPDVDEFEVPVKALKALVRTSSEAAEDSDPDLLRLLQDNLNTVMALKGDRELVVGNDAKGFKGLAVVPGTQTIAVGGALSWDHVIKATGLLVEAHVPGPYAVLLGPRPATALALVKEEASSNAYLSRPEAVPPVLSCSWFNVSGGASPKTSAIVYAPGQQMIVLRRAITVEIDRSEEFSRDAILARGRYRLGLGVPHPQSIVTLTGIDAPPIT